MKRIYKYKNHSRGWIEHYQEFINNKPERFWIKRSNGTWSCYPPKEGYTELPKRYTRVLTEAEFMLEML